MNIKVARAKNVSSLVHIEDKADQSRYILSDRETNRATIGVFASMEAAQKAMEIEEDEDRANGEYEPGFYQIIDQLIN